MLAVACAGCATGISGSADTISATSATVRGSVVSDVGGGVGYWAEYGTTPSYGSKTAVQVTEVAQNTPGTALVTINGLQRSTLYHYRICAEDSQQKGGPGCGQDSSFTTQTYGCGETVTTDFKLTGDLDCQQAPGFVVGANGVDINLNGHGLNGPTTGVGVDNTAGHDDVTIRDGSALRWGDAVRLSGASFNVLRNLDLRQGATDQSGARIDGGESNTIRSSQITGIHGLTVTASEALVVADSGGYGWQVSGVGARLVRNNIGAVGPFTPCLILSGNRNRVADNDFGGCAGGGIFLDSGGDNELVGNTLEGGLGTGLPGDNDGIRVQPFTARTLLQGNYAHGFHDDGIDVRAPATRLVGNRADNNIDFGIDAIAGVTDGGGNTASGNGGAQQCRNVVCGPSP